MISVILSTLVQLLFVLMVCGLAYLPSKRVGYLQFVGLKAAPPRIVALGALAGIVGSSIMLMIPQVRALAGGPGSVVAALTAGGIGLVTLAELALVAVVKTALAEEILFRGLLAGRFKAWWGFSIGNGAQAILFAAVHLLIILVGKPNLIALSLLVVFAGAMGWFSGWLKERFAGGSILPGIAAHACANLVTYLSLPLLFGSTG